MSNFSHEMIGDQQKIDSALRTVIADPAFLEKQKPVKTVKDLVLNETENGGAVVLTKDGLIAVHESSDYNKSKVFKLLDVNGDYPELGGQMRDISRYPRSADDAPFIDDNHLAFVMVGDEFNLPLEQRRNGKVLLREFYGTEPFKGLTAEKIMQVKQDYLTAA